MTESWKVLEKGFKRSGAESGDASLPDSCFFIESLRDLGDGFTLGCRPNLPEGVTPSDSLLRFALMARFFENKHKNPPAASS